MTTTTSIARAILLSLCFFVSINLIQATDNTPSEDFACNETISIMKMDCMFALVGSSPCYGSYHIMYAPTLSDPYVSIGSYSSGTFYNVINDGCYKLKKHCNNVCNESNVLVYSGCNTDTCEFQLDCPIDPILHHCYDNDGIVSFDASQWVSGCNQVEYQWTTPIGNFSNAYIGGYHGYGTFKLKVICHDLSCEYETRTVSFKVVKNCASQSCHFDVKWPLEPTIKHCYDKEGKVTIDAGPWLSGCSNSSFKWKTPSGTYHSDWISGHFGYGTFKLEVTCHDASCYGEKKIYAFELIDDCVKHQFDIYCPDDVYINCSDELANLDSYKDAYYIYNGKKVWLKAPKVHRHLNECNRGYITREWKVKDDLGKWHSCTQKIHVGQTAYGKPNIVWPTEEIELKGCNPSFTPDDLPYGAQKPYYENDGCSRFGHNYTDEVFYFNSTCKKVVRKWVVYDWCVYVPNSGSSKGRYTYYQKIKISSDEEPVVTVPHDIEQSSDDCDEAEVVMEDFKVKAESCGDKFKITHDSPYANKQGSNASGDYPVGETIITYSVVYGCGYTNKYKQIVVVNNDKAPTAYCIESIVVPLMGVDTDDDGDVDAGMVEIWAKDFDHKSEDRCGADINFSFSRDELVMNKTFTCAELGENELKIYLSNGTGRVSYCVVNLTIQNNAADIPNCQRSNNVDSDEDPDVDEEEEYVSMATISGSVNLHYGAAVSEASIALAGDVENMDEVMTDEEGWFQFAELPMGSHYKISPEAYRGDERYVTREDSDRLYDHLSGRDPLTDPYMLLAADIDQNGRVNFGDLALILNMERGLTDDRMIFVNAGYEFENPNEPWAEIYEQEHVIASLVDEEYSADFIAIPLGDLVDGRNSGLASQNQFTRNRSDQAKVSPNPFSYATTISFNNEVSQIAQLVVFKINGEKLIDRSVRLSDGQQQIDLGPDDIQEAGIYFYNITLADKTLKGKMIKIN